MKKSKLALMSVVLLAAVTATAAARQIDMALSLSTPYLFAGVDQTAYLKVSLSAPVVDRGERTAANVAIVLDRSGSMGGEKIERAKEAALLAIDLLDSRDIVSVITYSDTVSVLVPATRVSDRAAIKRMIQRVQADGNTAATTSTATEPAEDGAQPDGEAKPKKRRRSRRRRKSKGDPRQDIADEDDEEEDDSTE